MADIKIETPRGVIIQTENGKAELTWNKNALASRQQNFQRAQIFVDSEVLRLCSPLVPFQTGMLEKSGVLGTVVGSGEVRYIAPYAAKQYYDKSLNHSQQDHPQGGPLWFERMKAGHKKEILDGAKKIAGGG